MDMTMTSGRTTNGGGACLSCKNAKTRCDTHQGFPCERCKRMGRDLTTCIPQERPRGRPPSNPPSTRTGAVGNKQQEVTTFFLYPPVLPSEGPMDDRPPSCPPPLLPRPNSRNEAQTDGKKKKAVSAGPSDEEESEQEQQQEGIFQHRAVQIASAIKASPPPSRGAKRNSKSSRINSPTSNQQDNRRARDNGHDGDDETKKEHKKKKARKGSKNEAKSLSINTSPVSGSSTKNDDDIEGGDGGQGYSQQHEGMLGDDRRVIIFTPFMDKFSFSPRDLCSSPTPSLRSTQTDVLGSISLLPGHFAYPPRPPRQLAVADRAAFLKDYMANPFSADIYCRSACMLILTEFSRLKVTGELDLGKAIQHIKSHIMRVLRFGEEEYSQMLMELEGSLIGLKDWRQVLSPEESARIAALKGVNQANSTEFLQAKAQMESTLQSWADGSTPVSYSTSILGQSVTYCNDSYRALFLEDDAELDAFNARHLFAPFLWGKALCPDDHPAFFAAVVTSSCGSTCQTGECSLVVKCLTKTGVEFLGLARYRSLFSSVGVGHAFSIVGLPSSSDVPCTLLNQTQEVPTPAGHVRNDLLRAPALATATMAKNVTTTSDGVPAFASSCASSSSSAPSFPPRLSCLGYDPDPSCPGLPLPFHDITTARPMFPVVLEDQKHENHGSYTTLLAGHPSGKRPLEPPRSAWSSSSTIISRDQQG